VRSRRLGLAFCGLLLTGPGGLLGQSRPAATKSTTKAPPKKPVPTFTDDDLARYREERLRRESPDSEAAPPTDAVQPGPSPPLSPATKAAFDSVEIRDLNGTLPPEARAAAQAAGRHFVAFFGLPLQEPLVVPLRYLPDAAAYRDHLDRNVDSRMSWAGYYDPGKREIVVGSTPDYLPVLLHEINHFVFDTAFDEAPVWLREGLAEYFETASAKPEGLVVADQPRHRRQLAEWLKGRREPDLRQLLALNRSMWREHEVAGSARVRALSWSVVAFLMSSEGGRKAIHEFLASLKNQRGLYSLAAFDRSFPGGAAAFEREWLGFVEARGKAE
jgi:hypothetical protein